MHDRFRKLAQVTSEIVGSPAAFFLGVAVTVAWGALGPVFHYSDSWQLVINTGTTIATFLMVFLIQNTQNRDARVIHLKLDELIRAVSSARNELVRMEDLSDSELDGLHDEFRSLQEHATKTLKQIERSRDRRSSARKHTVDRKMHPDQ
jgi:low affinity Fe/Cu permease